MSFATELLFMDTLYVSGETTHKMLRDFCEPRGIIKEPTHENKVYNFYGKEQDLRVLKFTFLLRNL